MQQMLYEKNCAALVNKYGNQLPKQPPIFFDVIAPVRIVPGQMGLPNIEFDLDGEVLQIYDEPNPYTEIHALVKQELQDKDITHIVTLGVGLGYLLDEIIRSKEAKAQVFVVEPRIDVLFECFKYMDYSAVIEDELIVFVFENDGSQAGLRVAGYLDITDATYKAWRFVSLHNTFHLYGEFSSNFLGKLGSRMTYEKLNLNTQHLIGELFLKNSLTILSLINGASYVREYINIYAKKNCIIISAGPSLDQQLELLKKLQYKVTLIAVGQAIKTLHAAGINPHFVTAIDPHPDMVDYFDSNKYTHEVLVCSTVCDPSTVRKFKGRIIFSSYDQKIDQAMTKVMGSMGVIPSGGSVATYSYSLAKLMGFGGIAFVGQDLAYTAGRSHATGYLAAHSLTEGEMANNSTFQRVPGYYGGTVFTNQQMVMYREWFETTFSHDTQLSIYNCTEGGAFVRGAHHISLSEFTERLNPADVPELPVPAFPQAINKKKVLNHLSLDLRLILEINRLATQGLQACRKLEGDEYNVGEMNKVMRHLKGAKKLLINFDTKNYNPYLNMLLSHSITHLAKNDTPENASPGQIIKPFLLFFIDLNAVCLSSKSMLLTAIRNITKHIYEDRSRLPAMKV